MYIIIAPPPQPPFIEGIPSDFEQLLNEFTKHFPRSIDTLRNLKNYLKVERAIKKDMFASGNFTMKLGDIHWKFMRLPAQELSLQSSGNIIIIDRMSGLWEFDPFPISPPSTTGIMPHLIVSEIIRTMRSLIDTIITKPDTTDTYELDRGTCIIEDGSIRLKHVLQGKLIREYIHKHKIQF